VTWQEKGAQREGKCQAAARRGKIGGLKKKRVSGKTMGEKRVECKPEERAKGVTIIHTEGGGGKNEALPEGGGKKGVNTSFEARPE